MSVVEPSGQLYGSEFALLDVLGGLSAPSFNIEIVLPRGGPFSARLGEAGIPFVELLPSGMGDCSRLNKLLGYWHLMTRWRQRRPDLIYINQGGILRPIARLARWLRIPVLCQVQTLADAEWVGSLTGCHAGVSSFVCNSRFTAGHCHVPSEKLSIVYHGYKPKGLLRQRSPSRSRMVPMEVGLLGRICEAKGHYLVVEAARLLREGGSRRIHFRFIGDALQPEEGQRIRGLVERLGLADLIEFRGYRSNLASEFAQIELLVIPSRGEAFGRVLCEAAEAQVPVLVADSDGLGELARHFELGVRFAPNDLNEFVKRLRAIDENYETVRNHFTVGAGRMLQALDLSTYLGVMKELVMRAAEGRQVSLRWLGTDGARLASGL